MAQTIGGLTLAEWQAEAAKLTAARDKILASQDYSVGDGVIQRRNRRAELEQVTAALNDARAKVQTLAEQDAGGAQARRMYNIVPR
jgi:hypothetical protein